MSERSASRAIELHHVLTCPCGETLTGADEDEIVEVSFAHLRTAHPAMAGDYEREHILAMAQRLVRPNDAAHPPRERRRP